MSSSHEPEAERAARTQSAFREVNEHIEQLNKGVEPAGGLMQLVCECADVNCVEQLEMPTSDYDAIREHPNRFFVAVGHVYPDVEQVVAQQNGYVVVKKFAEDIARERDPRANDRP
jgi:hypothetical protein